MIVFKRVTFKVAKADTLAVLFQRVYGALSNEERKRSKIWFRFLDQIVTYRKTYGTKRLATAYPAVAPFLMREIHPLHKDEENQFIANLDASFKDGTPTPDATLDPSEIEAILAGIPRRFPIWCTDIVFDGISALDLRAEPEPATDRWLAAPRSPSIAITAIGFTRNVTFTACLPYGTPSSTDEKLPELPSRASDLFSAMGKVTHAGLIILHDDVEQKKIKAIRARSDALIKQTQERMAKLERKTDPGVPFILRKQEGAPNIPKLFKDAFKSLGYMCYAGYEARKINANNTVIVIGADVSPMYGQWLAWMGVDFALGGAAIQLGPKASVDDNITAVIENCAVLAAQLEAELVPKLEEIWGRNPRWFVHEYEKDKRMK